MYHELLDRPIAYHRILARIAGSVSGGVFLSQALYWSKRTTLQDSWFYKTADEWFDETFLTRREQETVRKRLVALKILEERKNGVPAKLYFRVNILELERHILRHGETAGDAGGQGAVQTSFDKNAKLGSTNPPTLVQQNRQTNTETTSKTTPDIKSISFDAEFEEFWAAYPKRPNNPRKKAMAAYRKARKNVSQKQLLTAVGLYAAYMAGENPKFVAMASTWLNEERWNCDYEKSAEVIQSYKDIRSSADMDDVNLTELVKLYPGHVGLYPEVQAAVKSQLRTGATLDQICEAAKKYAQYLKELRYDGREIAAPMIETWLKFKWREMDAYEFARVGPDRRLTVRPKRKVQA